MHFIAIVSFVIAMIAAVFGFGGIATGAVYIGQIIFYLAFAVFFVMVIASLLSGRRSIVRGYQGPGSRPLSKGAHHE